MDTLIAEHACRHDALLPLCLIKHSQSTKHARLLDVEVQQNAAKILVLARLSSLALVLACTNILNVITDITRMNTDLA